VSEAVHPARSRAGEPSARERVLRAAKRLFYEQGIRAVGVEAVVAEAGVTKMSLYRNFASKDELVAACLGERIDRFWVRWDKALAEAVPPGDPVAHILSIFRFYEGRTTETGFRGCPMTNAAIEFPEPDHPGRQLAQAHKRELCERLTALAGRAGARDATGLGNGLTLLLEGAYASSQTFGPDGPARSLVQTAAFLLRAHGCHVPGHVEALEPKR
jgi:AcrR family transcriptional regulator